MQWLKSQNGFEMDVSLFVSVCAGGDLDCVRWLKSEGCPWDETVPCAAAEGGHLKVLKWLIKEGCPYSKRKCRMAAARGEERARKVLEWLDDE